MGLFCACCVYGKPRTIHQFDDFLLCRLVTFLEDDTSERHLSSLVVFHPDDTDGLDGGMGVDDLLDLSGRHLQSHNPKLTLMPTFMLTFRSKEKPPFSELVSSDRTFGLACMVLWVWTCLHGFVGSLDLPAWFCGFGLACMVLWVVWTCLHGFVFDDVLESVDDEKVFCLVVVSQITWQKTTNNIRNLSRCKHTAFTFSHFPFPKHQKSN